MIDIFIKRPLYFGECIDLETGKMIDNVIGLSIDCSGAIVKAVIKTKIGSSIIKKEYKVNKIEANI